MGHIRKFWIIYFILFIILGVWMKVYSNNYELTAHEIDTIIEGKVQKTSYYAVTSKSQFADMGSNLLLTIGIAMFVSIIFVRAIEKTERDNFENRILDFQHDTAKDAILSSFEKIIDKEFFELIKNDIIAPPFIRRDLRWQYDISLQGYNKIKLTRTINYKLQNITQSFQTENTYVSTLDNIHCNTSVDIVKYKKIGENTFTEINLNQKEEDGVSIKSDEAINLGPGETAEVVTIISQIFPRNYIFETHFLNNAGINLELTVNLPENYIFSINTTVLNARTETIVDEPAKKTYRIKGAIYRGQGIEFLCCPIQKAQHCIAADIQGGAAVES